MASRYEPTLRELAMEPDEERRLEMAAEIDRDAADLDERWDNRDAYAGLEAERDRLAAERDDAIARPRFLEGALRGQVLRFRRGNHRPPGHHRPPRGGRSEGIPPARLRGAVGEGSGLMAWHIANVSFGKDSLADAASAD